MDTTESAILKRYLAVALTTTEKIEYGRKLAKLHQDYAHLEIEKKAAADRYKDALEELDGEQSKLARIIHSGEETREVECRWRYLWPTNTKELVRLDTAEIVESEAIPAEERQMLLSMEGR